MTQPSPSTDTVSVRTQRRRPVILSLLEQYALVLIAIAIFVFFALLPASSRAFPTVNNINVILGGLAVTALVAIGALFPLVSGYMDFSLGAVAGMSQMLTAGFMVYNGLPLWLSILLAILLSALVGVVNGLLVTRFGMNPFVTTLGMGMLITGLMIWYANGQTLVAGIDKGILAFGSARLFGWLPVVFLVTLVVAAIAWYFFTHTPFGRSLYAVGSNASAAKLVGIPVTRNVWWSFIVASTIAGAAGVMLLARVGTATATDGGSLLFQSLAAVFLGATAIRPGFFNVIGTLVGAFLVSESVSGLALAGAGGYASNVFNGVALLLAVGLSTYLGRRRRGKQ